MGVARPLEAIFAISKVERPEDKDYSFSRLVVQHIIPSRGCSVEDMCMILTGRLIQGELEVRRREPCSRCSVAEPAVLA